MTVEIGLSEAIAYAPRLIEGQVRGRTVVERGALRRATSRHRARQRPIMSIEIAACHRDT